MAQPEAVIKERLVTYMTRMKWNIKITHGNIYQAGLPDLYCVHPNHRQRWIEVKCLNGPYQKGYRFTKDQLEFFPLIAEASVGIWVLATPPDPSEEQIIEQYKLLWKPANWWAFLK